MGGSLDGHHPSVRRWRRRAATFSPKSTVVNRIGQSSLMPRQPSANDGSTLPRLAVRRVPPNHGGGGGGEVGRAKSWVGGGGGGTLGGGGGGGGAWWWGGVGGGGWGGCCFVSLVFVLFRFSFFWGATTREMTGQLIDHPLIVVNGSPRKRSD